MLWYCHRLSWPASGLPDETELKPDGAIAVTDHLSLFSYCYFFRSVPYPVSDIV